MRDARVAIVSRGVARLVLGGAVTTYYGHYYLLWPLLLTRRLVLGGAVLAEQLGALGEGRGEDEQLLATRLVRGRARARGRGRVGVRPRVGVRARVRVRLRG